ncbi:MAG: hypothetical protein GF331_13030, partial [Chitinivibrionales bacterium]|nr:hypothetical protein [Chitinivibrionales bacterium]
MRNVVTALLVLAADAFSEPLVPFVRSLLSDNATALETVLRAEYEVLCGRTQVDTDVHGNR